MFLMLKKKELGFMDSFFFYMPHCVHTIKMPTAM